MADIEIRRAHQLGLAAARSAAEAMAEKLSRKFGLKGDWDGDVLRFQGTGVNGTLDVTAKDISLSVVLGFMLKAMKGSIEQSIRHELDAMLASAPKPKKDPPPRKKGG